MPEIIAIAAESQTGQNMNAPSARQEQMAMAQPMHAPTDTSEDAGLAPYLGVIATIIIAGFLGWKYFKSKK